MPTVVGMLVVPFGVILLRILGIVIVCFESFLLFYLRAQDLLFVNVLSVGLINLSDVINFLGSAGGS